MAASPFFSIVTPSFNQARFIRETIDNVLACKRSLDDDLEYLICDNQSNDGTQEILAAYEKQNQLQVIRRTDAGHADAINFGWAQSHGQWLAWLNADDLYEPQALEAVRTAVQENPAARWIIGNFRIIDANGKQIGKLHSSYKNFLLQHYSYPLLLSENIIPQMSVFIRRDLIEEAGALLTNDPLTFDYEYWLRLGKIAQPLILNQTLSLFRYHNSSKTAQGFKTQFARELSYARQYAGAHRWPIWLHQINYYKTIWFYDLVKRF